MMRRVVQAALNAPVPWWISPGSIAAGVGANVLESGLSPATLRGGLLGGVLGLLLLCSLRRALVGHWR